ncbi:hypothetical protein E2C01_062565 [Portunus trituberculatus]|uniref:Uncharacterized protein n=1 Tax=Portunus trituberculatus TaxID=210409 RepID=A0A5B7HFN6_PORTR|nr:hypothetical protein [Portunus trituberculatus]
MYYAFCAPSAAAFRDVDSGKYPGSAFPGGISPGEPDERDSPSAPPPWLALLSTGVISPRTTAAAPRHSRHEH